VSKTRENFAPPEAKKFKKFGRSSNQVLKIPSCRKRALNNQGGAERKFLRSQKGDQPTISLSSGPETSKGGSADTKEVVLSNKGAEEGLGRKLYISLLFPKGPLID